MRRCKARHEALTRQGFRRPPPVRHGDGFRVDEIDLTKAEGEVDVREFPAGSAWGAWRRAGDVAEFKGGEPAVPVYISVMFQGLACLPELCPLIGVAAVVGEELDGLLCQRSPVQLPLQR